MIETISDDVFKRIHNSVDVLNNLQNCRDTFAMDRERIDEKLFEELSNFEGFVKRFEGFFLKLLMDDLKAISQAALINTNNSEKARELIEDIKVLMDNFSSMESGSIARSQSLIKMANDFRAKLVTIKQEMESKIKSKEKYRKEVNSAIIGLPQAN